MKTNLRAFCVLFGLLAALVFSGCASVERSLNNLPQVSAQELHVSQSNPWGSVQIDAENLQQTPTQATADSLTVQVSLPLVGTTAVTFKGYVRDKQAQP